MSSEPSGNHALPPRDDEGTFRIPRGVLVVVVAALIGGGGGSGLTQILRGTDHETINTLAEINAKLTVMNAKLDGTSDRINDHEARLRALEHPPKKER